MRFAFYQVQLRKTLIMSDLLNTHTHIYIIYTLRI